MKFLEEIITDITHEFALTRDLKAILFCGLYKKSKDFLLSVLAIPLIEYKFSL
jgi:hypothetical protein